MTIHATIIGAGLGGLAKSIVLHTDVEAALTEYDEAMFARSEVEAVEARRIQQMCFGDRAPFGLIDLFTGAHE